MAAAKQKSGSGEERGQAPHRLAVVLRDGP